MGVGRFADKEHRQKTIDKVKALRKKGMTEYEIAKKLGVTRSFVEYHTMDPEKRRRRLDARSRRWHEYQKHLHTGIRVCLGCGEEKRVTEHHLHRIANGSRSQYCAPCARARKTNKEPDYAHTAAHLSSFTAEKAREWALEVWEKWTPQERREVAEGLASAFHDDRSRPARTARLGGQKVWS